MRFTDMAQTNRGLAYVVGGIIVLAGVLPLVAYWAVVSGVGQRGAAHDAGGRGGPGGCADR